MFGEFIMTKYYSSFIIKAIVLIMSFLSAINCSQVLPKDKEVAIKYIYEYQSISIDGKLIASCDSMNIYYHGNYIIYQKPYASLETYIREVKNDTTVQKQRLQKVKYYYVISNSNKLWAFKFDSLKTLKAKKIDIDTFRKYSVGQGFIFS